MQYPLKTVAHTMPMLRFNGKYGIVLFSLANEIDERQYQCLFGQFVVIRLLVIVCRTILSDVEPSMPTNCTIRYGYLFSEHTYFASSRSIDSFGEFGYLTEKNRKGHIHQAVIELATNQIPIECLWMYQIFRIEHKRCPAPHSENRRVRM